MIYFMQISGSILLIRENYKLHIKDSSFVDSVSSLAGGAIHSALLNSDMLFENSVFFRCSTYLYGKYG